jgi:nicotinamidase-related amidase
VSPPGPGPATNRTPKPATLEYDMTPSRLAELDQSIVVVIDLQAKLMDKVHRPQLVTAATIRLLQLAEAFAVPVVLTEQYPDGLGPTHYLAKTAFGCCGDAAFDTALTAARPGLAPADRHVVIAGIEAHVCVMQTVIELRRAGSTVHLCWECISGRGEEYRRHALERMQQAGAQLTNHESVAFEWARDKNHAGFKAMNRILRSGQIC